ncbi:MAG TPA: hypothetical protein VGK43_07875, partial [Solirubrobacterales bacterium]
LLGVAALVAALMIGAGCGDGEDTASTPAGAAEAGAQPSPELRRQNDAARAELARRRQAGALTPEERAAKRAAGEFYAILGEDRAPQDLDRTTVDTASFCDLMSADARRQTVHYAKVSSGIAQRWNCDKAVTLLVLRAKRQGDLGGDTGVRVTGVNAAGGDATATVRVGRGPISSVHMIREDGEWKLAAAPTAP